jgi:uncharacterized membrane protein
MRQLKFSLLIVGIIGMVFSIIGLFITSEWTTNLMGFICGACLIYGYYTVGKSSETKTL